VQSKGQSEKVKIDGFLSLTLTNLLIGEAFQSFINMLAAARPGVFLACIADNF
jgi:hypothetical protein